MTSKRMLSKKQCIFVIVIMPLLLIPAFIILRMAEPKYDIDLLLSKHLPPDIVHMARKSTNQPSKCLNDVLEYIKINENRSICIFSRLLLVQKR